MICPRSYKKSLAKGGKIEFKSLESQNPISPCQKAEDKSIGILMPENALHGVNMIQVGGSKLSHMLPLVTWM